MKIEPSLRCLLACRCSTGTFQSRLSSIVILERPIEKFENSKPTILKHHFKFFVFYKSAGAEFSKFSILSCRITMISRYGNFPLKHPKIQNLLEEKSLFYINLTVSNQKSFFEIESYPLWHVHSFMFYKSDESEKIYIFTFGSHIANNIFAKFYLLSVFVLIFLQTFCRIVENHCKL